jgi:predicted nucleic acid-binding Zn ribbon protein
MKCPNCSNEVEDDKNFCGFCGYRLTSNQARDFIENAQTELAPSLPPYSMEDSLKSYTPPKVDRFAEDGPISIPRGERVDSQIPSIQRHNNKRKHHYMILFTFIGLLLGLLFIIVATLIALFGLAEPVTLDNIINLHLDTGPLFWLIDSVPIIMVFLMALFGSCQDKLVIARSQLQFISR